MRITKRNLRLIIENYLNESVGDNIGTTVSKMDKEIQKTLDNIKYDNRAKKALSFNDNKNNDIDNIDFSDVDDDLDIDTSDLEAHDYSKEYKEN